MNHPGKGKALFGAAALFFLLCVLLPFGALILAGREARGLYDDTYYGELPRMAERLQAVQGRKIVVIGNSGAAFGVDTAQMEAALRADGWDGTVCGFGLYGSLGTRLMLDLAEESIGAGDVVLFMPELNEQALSLYFSAKDAWYALNGHESLLFRLSPDLRGKLLGGYPAFVAESLRLKAADEKPAPSGVYARASFDERCDMKNAARDANTMEGLADGNHPILLEPALYDPAFVSYVNDYAERIRRRGADIYYCFCPMNAAAAQGDADAFYDAVERMFSFPMLGGVQDSLLEAGWFFDSNFHLNSAGMTIFTWRLTEQVKAWLGDTRRTELALPDMPGAAARAAVEGDDTDEPCFLYAEDDGGWRVVGVTEEGQARRELTVPCAHDGQPVVSVSADAFSGCRRTASITFQQNIRRLPDGLFTDCMSLRAVVLRHTAPEQLSVGYHLLDDAPDVRVQVPRTALSAFRNNYFWSAYAEVLTGYEE